MQESPSKPDLLLDALDLIADTSKDPSLWPDILSIAKARDGLLESVAQAENLSSLENSVHATWRRLRSCVKEAEANTRIIDELEYHQVKVQNIQEMIEDNEFHDTMACLHASLRKSGVELRFDPEKLSAKSSGYPVGRARESIYRKRRKMHNQLLHDMKWTLFRFAIVRYWRRTILYGIWLAREHVAAPWLRRRLVLGQRGFLTRNIREVYKDSMIIRGQLSLVEWEDGKRKANIARG